MEDDELAPDEPESRSEAFFAELGISRAYYRQTIDAAISHALAAPADADLRAWTVRGPRNLGGRIRALAQDPDHPAVIYAGLAQGGVFNSTDEGDTWQPMGRPQDAFPVGALALAPSNPNILYVGSGEPGARHRIDQDEGELRPREVFAAGRGFFRRDASAGPPTFVQEVGPVPIVGAVPDGAANGYARIVVDPDDEDRCWIASNTGLWRREAGPVFHREPVPSPVPVRGTLGSVASDVILVPHWNPNQRDRHRLYVAIAAVGIFRGEWNPNSGRVTWEARLENGLPDPDEPDDLLIDRMSIDRIRLAVSRSDPAHVYALFEDPGEDEVLAAYASSDGGNHWQERQIDVDLGGQPWVNLRIEVHPDNPALVVAGAVNLARSKDFGESWQMLLEGSNFHRGDRAQHSDQHDVFFDVGNPERLWVANDGGVSMAPDVVEGNPHTDLSWRKRSHGIIAAQFNDITPHPDYPFIFGGGLQDNSTYVGFGGTTWYSVSDGDGGQMAFEVDSPRRFFAPNQKRLRRCDVIDGNDGAGFVIHGHLNADQAPPNDVFAVRPRWIRDANLNRTLPLFIPILEHHPTVQRHLLVGRKMAGFVTHNSGGDFTDLALDATAPFRGGALQADERVTAIAYGHGIDWWIGTSEGHVYFGRHAAVPALGAVPVLPTWILTAFSNDRGDGTIEAPTGGNTVVGTNTDFLNFFQPGEVIRTTGIAPISERVITAVVNALELTVAGPAFVAADAIPAGTAYIKVPRSIGTIEIQDGSDDVQGNGTAFDGFFQVGDLISTRAQVRTLDNQRKIKGNDQSRFVEAVTNDTELTVERDFSKAYAAGTLYTRFAAGAGTVSANNGGVRVVGDGTAFQTFFEVGDVIWFRTDETPRPRRRIANIVSDTELDVEADQPFTADVAARTRYLRIPKPRGPLVTRIAVHPGNREYVAVATAGDGTASGTQGRVFLSLDHGETWADITGLAPVGAPVGPPPPPLELPPGPVTSLAFDPSIAAADPQHLYAGTLAGIYVIRNLPPANAAVGPVPPFHPRWLTFNDGLPLVLVKDLALVPVPATAGAAAPALESASRQRLVAALYGRGIWESDLTPTTELAGAYPAGGPLHRIHVRQHLIEEGLSYPRATPAVLNSPLSPSPTIPRLEGDPRMTAGTVPFTDVDAFDIRVDRAPFQFFDEVVDGVELDESLRTRTLAPGERHFVYVQAHSRGRAANTAVEARLFFATAPGLAAPLPDLHAGFWGTYTDVPFPVPGATPPAPRALWRRIGDHQPLTVGPGQPAVARFEWIPPAELDGDPVALLAVLTSVDDPLVPAGLPEVMADLVRQERRVALRIVQAEAFAPDIFVRDGSDDAGALGGVAFGGRSPDIIVVDAVPAQPPEQAFGDRLDPRFGDRIDPNVDNFVFIRVHNRSLEEAEAEVELYWVKANVPTSAPAADAPPFDQAQWNHLGTDTVDVPGGGFAFVRVDWQQADIPDLSGDPFAALTLVALARATTGPDLLPDRSRIENLDTFWSFFRVLRDSNNAAMRTVLYT